MILGITNLLMGFQSVMSITCDIAPNAKHKGTVTSWSSGQYFTTRAVVECIYCGYSQTVFLYERLIYHDIYKWVMYSIRDYQKALKLLI